MWKNSWRELGKNMEVNCNFANCGSVCCFSYACSSELKCKGSLRKFDCVWLVGRCVVGLSDFDVEEFHADAQGKQETEPQFHKVAVHF